MRDEGLLALARKPRNEGQMNTVETILALLQEDALFSQPWEQKRHQTALLTQALRSLSPEEAKRLIQWLLHQWEQLRQTDWLLGQVNATVPGALHPFHAALIERQVFYPGWLYLGAAASTRQELLRLVHEPANDQRRRDLVLCLAWIGDEVVQTQFQTWQSAPPAWQHSWPYGPLETYPLCAGWELTPAGHRRRLYAQQAFELVLPSERIQQRNSSFGMRTSHEEACHWCQRPLITLLDLDLSDPRGAAVVASGARLRIALCEWCSQYVPVFTDVDLAGASHWSGVNGEPPALLRKIGFGPSGNLYDWPEQRLILGAERRTPFETLGRFMLGELGISQVGGHPEWVQDPEYPTCPTCSRRMPCIGQVAWEDLEEAMEGVTYAFLCLSCQKATTCYQQT